MKQTITVDGMTCQNCVRHVTEALAGLPGVTDVHVNLDTSSAEFTVSQPVAHEVLYRVIDEAGYALI